MPSSRGSSQPRDPNQISHIAGGFFTDWAINEAQSQTSNINVFGGWFYSGSNVTNFKDPNILVPQND